MKGKFLTLWRLTPIAVFLGTIYAAKVVLYTRNWVRGLLAG